MLNLHLLKVLKNKKKTIPVKGQPLDLMMKNGV